MFSNSETVRTGSLMLALILILLEMLYIYGHFGSCDVTCPWSHTCGKLRFCLKDFWTKSLWFPQYYMSTFGSKSMVLGWFRGSGGQLKLLKFQKLLAGPLPSCPHSISCLNTSFSCLPNSASPRNAWLPDVQIIEINRNLLSNALYVKPFVLPVFT